MKPKTPEPEKHVRKPYAKPEVKEFGKVSELTRAVNPAGANDGGKAVMTKT